MKRIVISLVVALAACYAWAYDIAGKVSDTQGEPMPMATVRVLAQKDSTAVKGAITNDKGKYNITDLKKGNYILEASYVGYATEYRNINVSKNLSSENFTLAENASVLKDVTVTGIKTPIKVMEDTVEFNADSYKTQPNAVVEDLLKRLPGVEVDSEGKITHNGKEIKKILVDGQEFFTDDPKVASKNLPVNMVEKLQVIDRKSDLARLTGVDDGEDETVINLSVKKGMNNGWFGNVEAGYGTDNRYKGSFIVNRFWNGNQISILGGLNNINESNFTDGASGRFRRFGGDNGITKSDAFGINFNVGNAEIFRVGGDVMYSHRNSHTITQLSRQYLFNDSSSFYNSNKDARDISHNITANFRIKWDPDSFNTLEFRPNMSLNFSESESGEYSTTNAGYRNSDQVGPLVNENLNMQRSKGSSYEFGGRLIYTHRFKQRKGRSFSIYAQLRTSNVREYANTYSRIMYQLLQDSTIYDQFEDNHTWNNNFQSRVTWTEPIGDVKKGNYLEFAYQFQYRWNNADKLTYLRDPYLPTEELYMLSRLPGDVLSDSLSNRFRNDYMNQDIRVGYKHVTSAINLNVGMSLVPQMSKSINLIDDQKTIPERWVWNFAPYLRFRYKMTKTRTLNAFYQGRSSQPSMNQLQPVADVSDPLNIVQGNPDLNPSFRHNFNLRFQDFDQDAQRSIMAMLNGSLEQNSIVSKTTFNQETGGRFTTYENVNGIWNLNAFTMISFPLRNKLWTINNHFGGNVNRGVGFNNGIRNNSYNIGIFESFGIAFRPDNLELELRPTYRLQYSTNSAQASGNRTIHSYGGRFTATYYAPFGLVVNTDLNYTANQGYGEGYNKNEWMWNASIAYQFLKDRSLTVSLSGHDLLQQRSNVQRTVNASYVQDAMYNSLTRYFMVSVSWKFNTFGKGNEPADRNRPNWGGGGPMGPPPGGGRGPH